MSIVPVVVRIFFGSASSNARKILFRIATASARLFNPGAYFGTRCAQSSCELPLSPESGNCRQWDSLPVSITDEHALLMFVHPDDFTQDHNRVLLVSEDPRIGDPIWLGDKTDVAT